MADQMGVDNGNATISGASFTSGSSRIRPTATVSVNWGFTALLHPVRLQRAFTGRRDQAIKSTNIRVQFAKRHCIVVPNISYLFGVSATARVGTVTVTV